MSERVDFGAVSEAASRSVESGFHSNAALGRDAHD